MGKDKRRKKFVEETSQFSKTDMQRLGVFKEGGYISIGDPYRRAKMSCNEAAAKGRQMLSEGEKTRNATQDGYFAKEYIRAFQGDAYADPVRMRRQARLQAKDKNLGKDWTPTKGIKMPCGKGSYCPCINPSPEAFSPVTKTRAPHVREPKNFLTNPGKRGTGYGYGNITINPYPEHKPDNFFIFRDLAKKDTQQHAKRMMSGPFVLGSMPQGLFTKNPYTEDEGCIAIKPRPSPPKVGPRFGIFRPSSYTKWDGGMKGGTINKFPEYIGTKYVGMRPPYYKNVVNKTGRTYYPQEREKSIPSYSVVNYNVDKHVNNLNYKTVHKVVEF